MGSKHADQSTTLTTMVIKDLAAAEALATDWQSLADSCDAGPFARPGYALAWWRHLGRGRLRLVTVRENGELMALLPLHERRIGPIRVVRWLGHGLGTVGEMLARPGLESAARQAWAVAAGPGRILQLTETKAGSGGLDELPRLQDQTRLWAPNHWFEPHSRVSGRDHCPTIDVVGDAETQLAQSGQRRIRRTVNVARRRIEEAGLLHHVEIAVEPDRLESLLPSIREVYDANEVSRPRQHMLRPPLEAFTLDLLRNGIARGQVVALVGHLDGRPISFDLVLLTRSTMHSWVGRIHPAATQYSPGHLLRCTELDYAAEHNYPRIDMLLGNNQHKQWWASGGYDTCDVLSGPALLLPAVAAGFDWRERQLTSENSAEHE